MNQFYDKGVAILTPTASKHTDLSNEVNAALQQLTANRTDDFSDDSGFFLYDLDHLSTHLKQLMAQNVIKLWYAVKANPLSRIIKVLAEQGFNFDVASYGELDQVLSQDINADRILNTGPAKSKHQFKQFLMKGVNTFVVESLLQLQWLNEAAAELKCFPQVLLRVQLQWSEGEKNPLGGNELTPFGLSCEQWQSVDLIDFPALNINGLHIFQWGNLLDNAKMFGLWSQMVEPLLSLAQQLGMQLKVLDLGGGLGIDYSQTGSTLHWQTIVEDLAKIKSRTGVEELWLELGRYAVAESGYYITEVVDRKNNYQQEQLILSAGINHIIRPAVTGQGFPACLLRQSPSSSIVFDLHGPLCTSLDKLGTYELADDITMGDHIVFSAAGAYGFTESMPFFLCHPVAAEYVLSNGQIENVREAQPASWYLR